MGRRAPYREHAGDDPSGLAGWLYADLLLGFAVIFLGSLTFLVVHSSADDQAAADAAPTTSSVPSTTTTTTVLPTTVPPASVAPETVPPPESVPPVPVAPCSVDQIQLPRITVPHGDAAAMIVAARAAVPEGTRIGFALLFGGGTDDNADNRAAEVAEVLRSSMSPEFGTAVMRPFHDQSLSSALVHIDLYRLVGNC